MNKTIHYPNVIILIILMIQSIDISDITDAIRITKDANFDNTTTQKR